MGPTQQGTCTPTGYFILWDRLSKVHVHLQDILYYGTDSARYMYTYRIFYIMGPTQQGTCTPTGYFILWDRLSKVHVHLQDILYYGTDSARYMYTYRIFYIMDRLSKVHVHLQDILYYGTDSARYMYTYRIFYIMGQTQQGTCTPTGYFSIIISLTMHDVPRKEDRGQRIQWESLHDTWFDVYLLQYFYFCGKA